MRKIFTPFILASLAISLGYGLVSILTGSAEQVVKSEVNARRADSRTTRPQTRKFTGRFTEQATQVDQTADSSPILVNYLHQLQPASQEELEAVLNVAAEAQQQLLLEQTPTMETLEAVKSQIRNLSQTMAADFYVATERYLANLDRRREIKRDIALRQEQWQGWTLEAAAGMDRRETLAAADNQLQSLHKEMEALDLELNDHEAKFLGPEYQSYRHLLDSYKRESAVALDQEVILDKFDTILTAAHSVRAD